MLNTDDLSRKYDPYVSYYSNSDAGILGESNRDDRLHAKELVVGVVGDAGQKAYGFRHLVESGVVNDTFEGQPILVVVDPDSGSAAVYDRTLRGEELRFGPADGQLHVRDEATGSTWLKTTGEAVAGELQGSGWPGSTTSRRTGSAGRTTIPTPTCTRRDAAGTT